MVYSEKMALFYASIIAGLMKIMTPAIFLVDKISGVLMSLLHIDTSKRTHFNKKVRGLFIFISVISLPHDIAYLNSRWGTELIWWKEA